MIFIFVIKIIQWKFCGYKIFGVYDLIFYSAQGNNIFKRLLIATLFTKSIRVDNN